MTDFVFHFSEDPNIAQFQPHVPRTNPNHPPAVWAIDEAHSPLYWFPRDCPRVTAWPHGPHDAPAFRSAFVTVAERVHAIELGWLDAMRATALYRYTFDASSFSAWPDASGQWTSTVAVTPVEIESVGDLIGLHVSAGIELRAVPSLWPIHDLAVSDRWDFSIVRMRNAIARC